MFLKSICIFLVAMPITFAGEISVTEGLRAYQLKYSETFIELKAPQINLSLVKEACNEKLMKKINGEIELMLKKMTRQVQASKQSLKITEDAKDFYILVRSSAGRYFKAMPEEIQRLKIEESLRCSKK